MHSNVRKALAAIALTAVMMFATGCSLLIPGGTGTSQAPLSKDDQTRLTALNEYMELERATLPQIEQLYPGVYKDIKLSSAITTLGAKEGVAPGEYAVLTYLYEFAQTMDWNVAAAEFDKERAGLDAICKSQIFPMMKETGVKGLKGIVWNYTDGRSKPAVKLTHACYGE